MARLALALGLGLGLGLGGCTIDPFACSDAEQCDGQAGTAVCLPDGACAYPDDACDSGLRRSATAQENPATCVSSDGGTTTGLGSSGPGPTMTMTMETTMTAASTSMTGASTSGPSESSGTETCPATEWFPDGDGDGFGDADADATVACDAPDNTVDNGDDCNDADPRVRPDHLQCEDNPGLVAWYRLDENADTDFALDDAFGSVGTLAGAPSFGVEGVYGSAIRYAGHPDRIELAETIAQFAPDGAPGPGGTIEFWAQPDPLDESCAADCTKMVVHVSDDQGDGFGSNTPDLHIHLDHSTAGLPYLWRAHIDGAFAGGENCSLAGPNVEYDRWTHVALRWTTDTCALVVDGVSVDDDGMTVPSPPWTRARIGHPPGRPDRAFEGAIDELMIFDHDRSDAEIRRDCGRAPCPPA